MPSTVAPVLDAQSSALVSAVSALVSAVSAAVFAVSAAVFAVSAAVFAVSAAVFAVSAAVFAVSMPATLIANDHLDADKSVEKVPEVWFSKQKYKSLVEASLTVSWRA